MSNPATFQASDIPGFREALTAASNDDFELREDAWWDLTFDVCGLRLRTMTVRDYELLLRSCSPLLLRQTPSPEELIMFFWILSPEFASHSEKTGWLANVRREHDRRRHHRKCETAMGYETLRWQEKIWFLENTEKPFIYPEDSPICKMIDGAFKYIGRMFSDKPASRSKGGTENGVSYLTDWFCKLQREYHLPTDEIERMPLPQVFARFRELQGWHNPKARGMDFSERVDDLKAQVQRALAGGMSVSDLLAGKLKFQLNARN